MKLEQEDCHAEDQQRKDQLLELEQAHKTQKDSNKKDLADMEEATNKKETGHIETEKTKSDHNNLKKKLNDKKNELDDLLRKLKQNLSDNQLKNKTLKLELNQEENLKANGLTPDAQNLRKDNRENRQKVNKNELEVKDERSKKDTALNNHVVTSDQFRKLNDQYTDLLKQVEIARNQTE